MRTVPLSNVASINPRGDVVGADEEVSFVGMAQLNAQKASAVPLETRGFAEVSRGYTVFRDRDVLAAKITPCWENGKVGEARLAHRIGVGSTEFHVLRPGPDLDRRYMLRFLRQPTVRATGAIRMTGSGGQRRVPTAYLSELQIPLPPLEEQRRIAAVLDHADALCAKRRQVLAHLDTLTQSIFHSMFDSHEWPVTPVVDLAAKPDDVRCGPFGTQLQKSEFRDAGVPLLGIKNVNAKFRLPAWEFLDAATASRLDLYSLVPGDIVMTRKGTIGNCAVYPDRAAPGVMHSDLLRVRVDRTRVNPTYLEYQFHLNRRVFQQIAMMSPGAVMPGINVSKLKQVLVDVPPLNLQREFATRIGGIIAHRVAVQRTLGTEDELFATLQAHAFRGGL